MVFGKCKIIYEVMNRTLTYMINFPFGRILVVVIAILRSHTRAPSVQW
jgi:hypothetical protein